MSKLKEDLRKWFNPSHPEGGWKRINSKGEAIGPCAREPGEPKPKCMSNAKRAALTKQERAAAVRAKRKHDPNASRKGKPINVSNFGKGKLSEEMEQLDEKNKPTNPKLWSRAVSLARSKFDVYPSAYANGWAAKWYKARGGGWKTINEGKDEDDVGEMVKDKLKIIIERSQEIHDALDDQKDLPEWIKSKITLAQDYISTVADYMHTSEVNEGIVSQHVGKIVSKVINKLHDKNAKTPLTQPTDRRAYEVPKTESVEQIDELSTELLGRYKTAATAQASAADKAKDFAKGNKRFSGIVKATKKQFANASMKKEEVEQLDEVGNTPKGQKRLDKILDRATNRLLKNKGEERAKAEKTATRAWTRLQKESYMNDDYKRNFKRKELEFELRHEVDPPQKRYPAAPKIYHKVPFAQKDDAKKEGMRFDGEKKKWYHTNVHASRSSKFQKESTEMNEDLTPGRTEVDPTTHGYQKKRQSQTSTSNAFQRLKTVANLRKSTTRPTSVGRVPLKLPTPPRDHSVRESLQESKKTQILKDAIKKSKSKTSAEDKFQPEPELQSSMTRPQGE